MCKRIQHIILLLLTATVVCFTSCSKQELKPKNVLLFFSYDKGHEQYQEYLDAMTNTFEANGYTPNYRICYFDLEYSNRRVDYTLKPFVKQLEKEGWKPDIVITEGDRVVRKLVENRCDTILYYGRDIPAIFGALHYPNHLGIDYKKHQNIVIWKEPFDFKKNIDIAVELSGINAVGIEIDFNGQDSLERQQLAKEIAQPPYVNNSDFHHLVITDSLMQNEFKDSIVVCVLSAEEPWRNIPSHPDSIYGDNIDGKYVLQRYMSNAHRYPFIVAKKDVFCDFISMKTDKPQFTATRSVFNDGGAHYLAGYFASYSTIASDCALTAVRIFNGKAPSTFPIQEHEKNYWMDYNSMAILDMPYSDYSSKYKIVNAPFSDAHPYLWFATIVILVALIIGFILLVIWFMRRLRRNIRRQEKMNIEEARYLSTLCMIDSENIKIDSAKDIKKLVKLIHPDQAYVAEEILRKAEVSGTYNYSVLCKTEDSEEYEPWDFRFTVENKDVVGIAVNMKEEKDMQERIKSAVKLSDEAKKKEHFMTNLSNEIKRPLDIIYNCCKEIVAEGISEEKKKELSKEITKNSDNLTVIISDILLFSRIESGRQRYTMKEHNLSDIAYEFYESYKDKIPEHITFMLRPGRPNTYINVDVDRLRDVIYQYVSNAIKFTKEGVIIIGWRYYLGKHLCEFYIEDTGIGISLEKQKAVFDMFWRESEFIEGVGLGLNISKSLSEAMNGRIGVSSKENCGSRFSVWIEATHHGS